MDRHINIWLNQQGIENNLKINPSCYNKDC